MTLSPSNLMRNSPHIHQSVCFKPENNVSLSYRNIAALSLILGGFFIPQVWKFRQRHATNDHFFQSLVLAVTSGQTVSTRGTQ